MLFLVLLHGIYYLFNFLLGRGKLLHYGPVTISSQHAFESIHDESLHTFRWWFVQRNSWLYINKTCYDPKEHEHRGDITLVRFFLLLFLFFNEHITFVDMHSNEAHFVALKIRKGMRRDGAHTTCERTFNYDHRIDLIIIDDCLLPCVFQTPVSCHFLQ